MRTNFKQTLAANLITVIFIFILLILFDETEHVERNIILVTVGFIIVTVYDFLRFSWQKRSKK